MPNRKAFMPSDIAPAARIPMPPGEFKLELMKAAPRQRAFARSLTGKFDRADDLVQETIALAIANREKFARDTNMNAWLTTILRNQYMTEIRKRRREVEDADGGHAAKLSVTAAQNGNQELHDVFRALQAVPVDQREALLLVTCGDFSYEEAAAICGVAVGTIKSRINRARARLSDIMEGGEGLPPVRKRRSARPSFSASR